MEFLSERNRFTVYSGIFKCTVNQYSNTRSFDHGNDRRAIKIERRNEQVAVP